MKNYILTGLALLALPTGSAQAADKDFNSYVLKAVDLLERQYPKGGYDLKSAFTHDIPYADGTIRRTSDKAAPAPSMCVAGVAEVIITAILLYAKETGDVSVFKKVPASMWTRGNVLSLRANIFMYSGTRSRGTADTLQRFGMGHEFDFEALRRGDFVNLNRTTKSGHAVVFMGFLDGSGNETSVPSAVRGFKYFSLQGKGKPDAGFGYRWAFFEGTCPTFSDGRTRDCHIIRSSNPVLLNTGRMDWPTTWRVDASVAKLAEETRRDIQSADPTVSRAVADQELQAELPAGIDPSLDGITQEN